MIEYEVRLTQAAQDDMVNIHRYIFTELSAPVTADKMIDAIESSLAGLSRLPHSYPKVRDDRLSARGYHWLGIKNHMAFFTIDESKKTVFVERILYGRRNWQRLL